MKAHKLAHIHFRISLPFLQSLPRRLLRVFVVWFLSEDQFSEMETCLSHDVYFFQGCFYAVS